MTIEEEIWDEFNEFSNVEGIKGIGDTGKTPIFDNYGKISRIDGSQNIWHINSQIATDELIDKVLLKEKKWEDIIDDLPKRITGEYKESEYRQLNKYLLSIFQDENDSNEYLKIKTFPTGVHCPKCYTEKIYYLSDYRFKCSSCLSKFSIKSSTVFNNTKLPLVKWYGAIVILKSGNRISTPRLSEILKITQKTSYYMSRKIKDNFNNPFLHEINKGIFQFKP